jgi:hypothetical protein
VTFSLRRSFTIKTFAIIIFLGSYYLIKVVLNVRLTRTVAVMWGPSLSIFAAMIAVWFLEVDVKISLIAISTRLLFALPSIRNSQPGVPITAGTTSDSECTAIMF